MTYTCVNKIIIIGSDNDLSPGWCHAIIWNKQNKTKQNKKHAPTQAHIRANTSKYYMRHYSWNLIHAFQVMLEQKQLHLEMTKLLINKHSIFFINLCYQKWFCSWNSLHVTKMLHLGDSTMNHCVKSLVAAWNLHTYHFVLRMILGICLKINGKSLDECM